MCARTGTAGLPCVLPFWLLRAGLHPSVTESTMQLAGYKGADFREACVCGHFCGTCAQVRMCVFVVGCCVVGCVWSAPAHVRAQGAHAAACVLLALSCCRLRHVAAALAQHGHVWRWCSHLVNQMHVQRLERCVGQMAQLRRARARMRAAPVLIGFAVSRRPGRLAVLI